MTIAERKKQKRKCYILKKYPNLKENKHFKRGSARAVTYARKTRDLNRSKDYDERIMQILNSQKHLKTL
jgi:hypothetical protein